MNIAVTQEVCLYRFMSLDELRRSPSDPLLVMLSSVNVYFMASCKPQRESILYEVPLARVVLSRHIPLSE